MPTATAAIIRAKLAEIAETTQYESENCQTMLDKLTATNITGSTATITMRIVNSGGTAGGADELRAVVSILPGKSYQFPELVGHTMESGDFISTIAGTASAIEIRGSARKIV